MLDVEEPTVSLQKRRLVFPLTGGRLDISSYTVYPSHLAHGTKTAGLSSCCGQSAKGTRASCQLQVLFLFFLKSSPAVWRQVAAMLISQAGEMQFLCKVMYEKFWLSVLRIS